MASAVTDQGPDNPDPGELRNHAPMNEQPAFHEPWWDLRQDGSVEHRQREALHAELLTEVAVGHPLHGLRTEVIARSQASDDIVVELATGGWARVHLTYKRAPETPPWPNTTFYDTIHALERDLREPS